MHKQTKAFLDKTIAEPKKPIVDVYIETKETKSVDRKAIGSSASRLYNSPSSKLYLKKHRNLAKKTKLELLEHARKNKDRLGYASLANTISEQILDRTDGKPIAMTENRNLNLNLNIEASKELSEEFNQFIEAKTRAVWGT